MDFPTLKRNKALSLFISLSFLFFITFYNINHPKTTSTTNANPIYNNNNNNCAGVRKLPDRRSKCEYVKSNTPCKGKGYLNYLELFYCTWTDSPPLAYSSLLLWLLVLFYVLGNTTSDYFCPSVESLSRVLRLSPTIAGTTLLPLGNGANDVFASIISFTRSGDANVGLNSVLGGGFFISCFVVGVISVSISSRRVRVDRASFVRDVLFLLFVLCCLLLIVFFGRINFWFSLGFVSVYVVYIGVVSGMHLFCNKAEKTKLIPDDDDEIGVLPLLLGYSSEDDEEKVLSLSEKDVKKPWLDLIVYVLELPLSLPRRLTIPVVNEEKWSKAFAASSATLAPVFLAAICDKLCEIGDFKIRVAIYSGSVLVGITLGALALGLTEKSGPPKRFLIVWLGGGFLMSTAWTYVVVEELVSLLVALGHILGISTSVLGVTVLAWGNSLGDLISNWALATRGGPDGAQVALSGCYAGPLFNTLMGLGVSFVLASWDKYPASYPVPRDYELYETVGFLMGGLFWALVILPKRNMRLDKSLGVGLLAIYFCFLFLRLVKGVGLLKFGT